MASIIDIKSRLSSIINKDQNIKTDRLEEVIKSDIIEVLQNYFVFDTANVKLQINQKEEKAKFSFEVDCEKIKNLNYLK